MNSLERAQLDAARRLTQNALRPAADAAHALALKEAGAPGSAVVTLALGALFGAMKRDATPADVLAAVDLTAAACVAAGADDATSEGTRKGAARILAVIEMAADRAKMVLGILSEDDTAARAAVKEWNPEDMAEVDRAAELLAAVIMGPLAPQAGAPHAGAPHTGACKCADCQTLRADRAEAEQRERARKA